MQYIYIYIMYPSMVNEIPRELVHGQDEKSWTSAKKWTKAEVDWGIELHHNLITKLGNEVTYNSHTKLQTE